MSLDGVSPKNAVCTHCGFHLGGIPIRGTVVICPECGKAVIFDFAAPVERARARTPLVLWALLLLPATAVATVAFWESGWKEPRTAGIVFVGMLGGMLLVLVTMRAMRRGALD